jgi:transcriptional regulator with XRE-family HTH domain
MIDENANRFWSRYKQLAPKDCPVLTKTNIPQSTLATWRNKSIFPRADEACKIAGAIHTTVEYLVSGKTAVNDFSPAALEIAVLADQLNKTGFKIIRSILSRLILTHPKD